MLVFAVESSCDETSVCILNKNKEILSHIIFSQKEHSKFGGVIPELASRAHLQILQKITKQAFLESKIKIRDIDLLCATVGPGLIGGLLVGSTFAKGIAVGMKKPFIPINHLEGHLLSPTFNNNIEYPYLTFLLTGGHTQIYLVKAINNYELLGETLDDAIGEAFDKVAKLLNMPYPGGPEIEICAQRGDENFYNLPHPLKKKKELNFSFSGIKTAINLIVKKNNMNNKNFKANISASFQKTISQILEEKLNLVMDLLIKKKININQIALVGGVAANEYISEKLNKAIKKFSCSLIKPPKNMLSDNAAMIGWACIQKNFHNSYEDINFKPNPRLKINNISK